MVQGDILIDVVSQEDHPGMFGVTLDQLVEIIDSQECKDIVKLGGGEGIFEKLHCNPKDGISSKDGEKPSISDRRVVFGSNCVSYSKKNSFFHYLWLSLNDSTLILLFVASVISLCVGVYDDFYDSMGDTNKYSWVEGLAILLVILIVSSVSSSNDYHKEKQFQQLNMKKEERKVKVMRDGKKDEVSIKDIVVGDIVIVESGDIVPADGVLIANSNLVFDESSVTGESDNVYKDTISVIDEDNRDIFVLSGTKVMSGMGKMLVLAVGKNSSNRVSRSSFEGKERTPLQKKLNRLAESIAKMGLVVSIFMLFVLTLKYFIIEVYGNGHIGFVEVFGRFLEIFIQSITILVVAVPEGLPMAVTISLAFATSRMIKDNNLVRVLSSCETMGSATTICSDKTGTITSNIMCVVQCRLGWSNYTLQKDTILDDLSASFKDALADGISLNSTAFKRINLHNPRDCFVGSKTEIALLRFLHHIDADHKAEKEVFRMFPFSSANRMMAIVSKDASGNKPVYKIHVKGASEAILEKCVALMHTNGKVVQFNEVNKKQSHILYVSNIASEGLRTISLAYKDIEETEAIRLKRMCDDNKFFSELDGLTLFGIMGIEDPIREGVPDSVLKCQSAGICVRMVTGDNVSTAVNVAKKCNILTRGGLVIEGKKFRKLSDDELDNILPRLQVLARSSPADKELLVRKLKGLGEIVAVTGDGTNDVPAFRSADISFSMGISGTDIAKEASSIIIMDDNLNSIVKAVLWGRCITDSVQKFLQFQLTVNISAVVISMITSSLSPDNKSVLNAIQLLWVNMLMDTFAALALATDNPSEDLLDRPPERQYAPLITHSMWKMIIGQSLFQIILILSLFLWGSDLLGLDLRKQTDHLVLKTFIFNVFILSQFFNEINARSLDRKYLNPFRHFFANRIFLCVMIITIVLHVLIIHYGGLAFETVGLGPALWAMSVIISFLTIPLSILLKMIPDFVAQKPYKRISYSKEALKLRSIFESVKDELMVFKTIRGLKMYNNK